MGRKGSSFPFFIPLPFPLPLPSFLVSISSSLLPYSIHLQPPEPNNHQPTKRKRCKTPPTPRIKRVYAHFCSKTRMPTRIRLMCGDAVGLLGCFWSEWRGVEWGWEGRVFLLRGRCCRPVVFVVVYAAAAVGLISSSSPSSNSHHHCQGPPSYCPHLSQPHHQMPSTQRMRRYTDG